MKKTIFAVLVATLALGASASEYRVEKVKVIGSLKHKVIFQSRDLKKVRGSNVLKGKLVSQWGTEVFEVVTGLYTCNTNKFCKLTDFERVATFKSCVVKSKTKVQCSKRIGGDSYSSGNYGSEIVFENPDSVSDEYNHGPRSGYDDYSSEFPVRVQGEYDDVHF